MGTFIDGEAGGGGMQWRNTRRKEWEMCLLLPRWWTEKQVVIFDSRWTCFQRALKGLLWEGKSELFGKLFLCVALLLGRGKTKRKTPSCFLQKNFNLGACSYGRAGDGKEVNAHGVASARKPSPNWLKKKKKRICSLPYGKVHGQFGHRDSFSQDLNNSMELSIFLSFFLSSPMIASFFNLTRWYNGCLYLQANIIPDFHL